MFTFICFINNAYSSLRCFSSSNDTELFPKRFAHFINSSSFCRKLLRYYVLCKCETPIESPMNRFKISTCKSIMKTERKKINNHHSQIYSNCSIYFFTNGLCYFCSLDFHVDCFATVVVVAIFPITNINYEILECVFFFARNKHRVSSGVEFGKINVMYFMSG